MPSRIPRPSGSRFNNAYRGAWYATVDLQIAHAESMHRRRAALAEIGALDTVMRMHCWLADFVGEFHDLTPNRGDFEPSFCFEQVPLGEPSNKLK